MKLVTAIIRHIKFEEVHTVLTNMGLYSCTVTEVRGSGQQKGHTEIYREAEFRIEFSPKVKIEIAVNNEIMPEVVEAIRNSAYTGKVGDGLIYVYDLEETCRIRTGERGPEAL